MRNGSKVDMPCYDYRYSPHLVLCAQRRSAFPKKLTSLNKNVLSILVSKTVSVEIFTRKKSCLNALSWFFKRRIRKCCATLSYASFCYKSKPNRIPFYFRISFFFFGLSFCIAFTAAKHVFKSIRSIFLFFA